MRQLLALNLILLVAFPAGAWFPKGHEILTLAAVAALPQSLPEFFRSRAGLAGHLSWDPDIAKNPGAPQLNDAEFPEHFIDSELLRENPLPNTRFEFYQLCRRIPVEPKTVGMAPYAIAEWSERLMIAFAEHRKRPNDPAIRTKCLVYAGLLAHYSEDLCQPLHTTVHYDGRTGRDFRSPHSGIHAAVDGLVERLRMSPAELSRDLDIAAFSAFLPAILEQLQESHSQVDRVYEIEKALRAVKGATAAREAAEFAALRARASVRFTARLYLTAWERSTSLVLPAWLAR